jgi:hypothetical protein
VGVSDQHADYAFTISGLSAQRNGTVTLGLPAEGGNLTIAKSGAGQVSKVNLKMTRYTTQGTQVFSHNAVALAGGDTAQLEFGGWTRSGQGIALVTSHDGHQVTQTLSDQATGVSGTAGSASGPSSTGGAGATGANGAPGATGAAGANGATGAAGANGTNGATGATGATGPTGPPGLAGPTGAPGPAGASGITNGYQGVLEGGTQVRQQATVIVQTPSLPAGHYAVTAQVTVSGSASNNRGQDHGTDEVSCWVTADSAATSSNHDGVTVAADIGSSTQTLTVSDLVSPSASPDRIDLVCRVLPSSSEGVPTAQVTTASITALQLRNAVIAPERAPQSA